MEIIDGIIVALFVIAILAALGTKPIKPLGGD